jgi:hypothetical protein
VKIQRSSNGQVTHMLSGQIGEEDMAELEALIKSEAKRRRMVFSSEREAVSPSRLEELPPDDDTRNDSKASAVQREYTLEQELIVWALIKQSYFRGEG